MLKKVKKKSCMSETVFSLSKIMTTKLDSIKELMDADEILHEDDYEQVRQIIRNFPKMVDIVALPIIEYWGSKEKVRVDINPWKWRLSRNLPHITQGIPAELRKFDDDGNEYDGYFVSPSQCFPIAMVQSIKGRHTSWYL